MNFIRRKPRVSHVNVKGNRLICFKYFLTRRPGGTLLTTFHFCTTDMQAGIGPKPLHQSVESGTKCQVQNEEEFINGLC